jgi:serine-type D-Ala-D-Ala carboxypeptidase (penicillin-binding protein 5/6)
MNARAAELGLGNTSYANPIGLDESANYSSARDLSRLAVRLMRNRRFAGVVDKPRAVLESGSRRRVVGNRNKLVGRYPFVDGIKTGHTLNARYVLVGAGSAKRGARVVSVVMGEPSETARDADTLELLRFGLAQFSPKRVLTRGKPVARLGVEHRERRVAVAPDRSVTVTLREGQRTSRRIDAPDELEGPIAKGERVGSVTVLRGRERVGRARLVAAEDVPGPSLLRRAGGPLTVLAALAILAGAAVATVRLRARSRTESR